MDGLPSEDAEEGKKTIDEAISDNYPPQVPKPMEDEKEQVIDLSDTLFAEGVEQPKQPREHVTSASADDVIITIDEEEPKDQEQPQQQTSHSPFGWIRRK